MKTIKEKNERAKGLVDYVDSPSLVRDLMHALDGELDWKMKSLVYYHLIRRLMDDGTFAPEQEIEMENVQRPFDARTWYLPSAVAFPVYDAGAHTFMGCFKGGETTFVVNLCAFVEENPVIGFRYACEETYGDTILIKGLVPHYDVALQSMYPSWEFYRADRALTDDMTALRYLELGSLEFNRNKPSIRKEIRRKAMTRMPAVVAMGIKNGILGIKNIF